MEYWNEFRQVVEANYDTLRRTSETLSGQRPRPGKWSIKEIVGHLIDSASNNHQRFVRAQFQDDLVFPPYAQDDWVSVQKYQEAPWEELVELWYQLNRQIARVMEATPVGISQRPTTHHNFDRIAWQTVPKGAPSTLEYFMMDYVGHLRHHLKQIDEILLTQDSEVR